MIKDRGTVLCASICALTVKRGGVMDCEEHVQQVAIRKNGRIKLDLHYFGMPCISVADCAIGWVLNMSTGIAGFNRLHTFHFIKNSLQTPEASPSQRRSFKMVIHDKFSFYKLTGLSAHRDAAGCRNILKGRLQFL